MKLEIFGFKTLMALLLAAFSWIPILYFAGTHPDNTLLKTVAVWWGGIVLALLIACHVISAFIPKSTADYIRRIGSFPFNR